MLIQKDLAIDLFIGGTVGMMACGILNIWGAMGMAPLVLIIILDIALAFDRLVDAWGKK
jgi:hypothetical protein